jgi:nucleoside-diphosphate-sugar epimerase
MTSNKTVLVTGSHGFVGSHLVPELEAAGYAVTTVDKRFVMSFEEFVIHYGDYRFDTVIHLAANIEDIDARMQGKLAAYEDIKLDMLMAEYVMRTKPNQLVWPTSCATDWAADPYAWVKLTGEKIFSAVNKEVPVVMLRPYSGYGGDQALSYPFPAILNRAMTKQDPLMVWGSGKQVRDFLHIDDLVDAFMFGVQGKFPAGLPIDIGTGKGTDFLTLAAMMADAIGYNTSVKPLISKAESSGHRVANTSMAKRYGYEAKISLGVGIRMELEKMEAQLDKRV